MKPRPRQKLAIAHYLIGDPRANTWLSRAIVAANDGERELLRELRRAARAKTLGSFARVVFDVRFSSSFIFVRAQSRKTAASPKIRFAVTKKTRGIPTRRRFLQHVSLEERTGETSRTVSRGRRKRRFLWQTDVTMCEANVQKRGKVWLQKVRWIINRFAANTAIAKRASDMCRISHRLFRTARQVHVWRVVNCRGINGTETCKGLDQIY